MSYFKEALDNIKYCEYCNGKGYTGWANSAKDWDFEWCSCNPAHIYL